MKKNFIIITLALLAFISCEEERFITGKSSGIEFSVDTVYFDTVFTQLGTATRRFTIRNPHNGIINISELYLAGGDQSVFQVNVDGLPGSVFNNIEIPPKDSIYVFVEATLDPNNSGDILLQQDSLVAETNGKIQDLDIVAWGQDVHMIRDSIISTQTWTSEKPYLILDAALVDTGEVLTINPGVRVYFHRDAVLFNSGTIISNGTLEEPVLFSGDRLEKMYEDIPGQWGGIYFLDPASDQNYFNFTNIKCGTWGIWIDDEAGTGTRLEIINSTIAHMNLYGIFSFNGNVEGYNNLFYNCGSACLAAIGGTYMLNHSTIANRWGFPPPRKNPSLYISNYLVRKEKLSETVSKNVVYIFDIQNAEFTNSIIYGNQQNEIFIDQYEEEGILEYNFTNCLIRLNEEEIDTPTDHFSENIFNEAPKFISWNDYDFRLDTLSPAKDKGLVSAGIQAPLDLKGDSRTADGLPDIGAFERIEEK